ncbi:M4 family metallopeptidase [Pseudosporangium ferrugineum]|uniref:Neutral metalloproteinase n=1 Tax=Pseudosporangium ferrugineum TaxID=439699 RepID=A0A2T0RXB1_9ACTN|nr:M4 family metallopeptidase [Pseudosporangium ferrugineum]PRY25825.1 thermolysin metallopeptidase-like protein [Pseudosporangium ferrugineum]
MTVHRRLTCITPPYILQNLLGSDDAQIRRAALATLVSTAQLRGQRELRAALSGMAAAPVDGRRTVFDCRSGIVLRLAVIARSEGHPAVADDSVNRAYDGFGVTRDFLREVFERDSIDGRGMRLHGYVHRGVRYNNAFWDGSEMVFGDGDGLIFSDFTGSLDVIAHELAHGVTEFTAGWEYHGQSGALNESMSDVFGAMVKQWALKQSAADADWLIGADVFTPGVDADALRSLKAPGTAFDNELFGKDPQPAHMDDYVRSPDTEEGDFGGVHVNSGIPNKAFHLLATALGGNSWEAPGRIWYESLKASTPLAQFTDFATTTHRVAGDLFGAGGAEQQAVAEAWGSVGVPVATAAPEAPGAPEATIAALSQQVEALNAQVRALATDIQALSGRP